MNDSQDYSQPEFFRFGWDSLFLVREVLARTCWRERSARLLELGAGSGVVACEISHQMPLESVTLVEAQPEWREHLESNLARFCRSSKQQIHWQRVSEFNQNGSEHFSLVVSNPPYFTPESGRPSPDHQRNIAHRLVLDPWEEWLACMERSLAVGGEAWFLLKDSRSMPVSEGFTLQEEMREGPMRLLCLRRL